MRAKDKLIQMLGKQEAEKILALIRNAKDITIYSQKEELDD